MIDLVAPHIRVDGLLLRYALALRDDRSPRTEETVAQLRARFAANAARLETAHKREEARFVLEFENDPARALTLARENWAVQKEPADLRILVACARRAHSAEALMIARDWLATTGLEDRELGELLLASTREEGVTHSAGTASTR